MPAPPSQQCFLPLLLPSNEIAALCRGCTVGHVDGSTRHLSHEFFTACEQEQCLNELGFPQFLVSWTMISACTSLFYFSLLHLFPTFLP